MGNINIYEKLNIKDYYDVGNLVREINSDYTSGMFNAIVLFGDFDFIINVMIQLITRYGYIAHTLDIDREAMNVCGLELNGFGIFAEDAYGYNTGELKVWFDGCDRKDKCYLHQDYVKQDLVDYCLNNCNNTVLFGIGCDE